MCKYVGLGGLGGLNFMEIGSLVEVTVHLNHSAYTELLDNQVLPSAPYLTDEHNTPIPVFQHYSSHIRRTKCSGREPSGSRAQWVESPAAREPSSPRAQWFKSPADREPSGSRAQRIAGLQM